MLWYEISLVWFGFGQDWSVGGNDYSGGLSWVVFMGELSVPAVFCFAGRIWGQACGSMIFLSQTLHPTCCHRLACQILPITQNTSCKLNSPIITTQCTPRLPPSPPLDQSWQNPNWTHPISFYDSPSWELRIDVTNCSAIQQIRFGITIIVWEAIWYYRSIFYF